MERQQAMNGKVEKGHEIDFVGSLCDEEGGHFCNFS